MSFHHPSRRPLRRLVAVAAALAVTPAVTLAVAPPSQAADPVPFYVVGTSDVSDSNLMAAVIEPGFEKAYPQYDLRYQGTGTNNAITVAKTGGAAALLVHAASVENQFVQQGYSLEGPGRSLFWGDYVLVGPTSDPAGVANGGAHDIAAAFQKVAAAGAAGQAKFYERTTSPGTSIQERQIWATTTGVPLCTVNAASGGGARPTNGPADCGSGTATAGNPDNSATYPAWYQGNAANQGANLIQTSTCVSQGGNCYDFVDRGTFDYQQSIGNATNLTVLTRDNDAAAKGGQAALINAFHGYAINPAAVPGGSRTDATAAKLFLDFLTSAAEQQQIGYYLGKDKPFVPAAAPTLTSDLKRKTVSSNGTALIKGNLANSIPGYPNLSGEKVNLLQANSDSPLAVAKVVASDTTNYKGNFKIKQKLKPGKFYSIGVAGITKVEVPSLSPQFSDILQPTSTPLGQGAKVVLGKLTPSRNGTVLLSGRLGPKSEGKGGRLIAYAAHPGKKLKRVDSFKLHRNQKKFNFRTKLGAGSWRVELVYSNGKQNLLPAASVTRTVNLS